MDEEKPVQRDLVTLSTQTLEDTYASMWDIGVQVEHEQHTVATETDFNISTQRNSFTSAIDLVLVHRYTTFTQTPSVSAVPVVDRSFATDTLYTFDRSVGDPCHVSDAEIQTEELSVFDLSDNQYPKSPVQSPSASSSLQLSPSVDSTKSSSLSFGLSMLSDGDVESLLQLIDNYESFP
ncbi:hypothetical protein GEMRC1_001450 [Eukaryota sp. GEM-RC1]